MMKKTFITTLFFLLSHLSFAQDQPDLSHHIKDTTTIKREKIKADVFKYYPNPVEDELFILGTNKIKSIEFLNIMGERVTIYWFNKSIIKINVSNIKKGIYLLKVIDEKEKLDIKKIIIN